MGGEGWGDWGAQEKQSDGKAAEDSVEERGRQAEGGGGTKIWQI